MLDPDGARPGTAEAAISLLERAHALASPSQRRRLGFHGRAPGAHRGALRRRHVPASCCTCLTSSSITAQNLRCCVTSTLHPGPGWAARPARTWLTMPYVTPPDCRLSLPIQLSATVPYETTLTRCRLRPPPAGGILSSRSSSSALRSERPGPRSALHLAAGADALQAVRCLVESGADTAALDAGFGPTPLGWAQYFGNRQVAEYLRHSLLLGDRRPAYSVLRVAIGTPS